MTFRDLYTGSALGTSFVGFGLCYELFIIMSLNLIFKKQLQVCNRHFQTAQNGVRHRFLIFTCSKLTNEKCDAQKFILLNFTVELCKVEEMNFKSLRPVSVPGTQFFLKYKSPRLKQCKQRLITIRSRVCYRNFYRNMPDMRMNYLVVWKT